ncbi:glutathione S-transferase [Methylobacterium sp. C25]|uniref:MAPEG family protein n=1 Tax=Methylobacterium sp. C25 TaxID=2721622 RepID=UPI001F1DD066|nr:MAPEG family protein [Methylobacterium sp. C25]MCE4224145.1 glutathione S-transferase [Methylobacterium sp. C25]
MIFPATTAFFAGLFGLLHVGLTGWVVAGRVQDGVLHGSGGDPLLKRIRSQGNFSENVPLALLLVAFAEARGTAHWIVEALLVVLLAGRLLHPYGMFAAPDSPRQFACRGGGILSTLLVILVSSILLLT